MPSDARTDAALKLLARRIAAYRSFVAAAREHARGVLSANGSAAAVHEELGALGARIDPDRFASIVRFGSTVDALGRARSLRAAEVLDEIATSDAEAFVVDVRPGASLYLVVRAALARLGRAFGLAAIPDVVRAGSYDPGVHDAALDEWPVELWTARERRAAPPLVVTVNAADLRVGEVAELLDGSLQIILLVHGRTAPARLVRAITPGVLVVQARDLAALERITSCGGPALAAVFDEEAVCFTHDPAAGPNLWQRLAITSRPAREPKRRLGGLSPEQQRDELKQLEALAERPELPVDAIAALVPAGNGDAADRLAAWLLAESGATAAR
ncbi:MAG TPA: hypothetical protein VHB25_08245 [Gemmatimonadaceae bacterium]|nr:hypothetical protein [Gemmatimonadaceae bacterium]